jgi:hypothetical protein
LELTLKPGFAKPYAKLEMTVVKATMLPENLKMFDKAGKLWKECGQRSQKIGQYNIIHYFSMQDLQKKKAALCWNSEKLRWIQDWTMKFLVNAFLKNRRLP